MKNITVHQSEALPDNIVAIEATNGPDTDITIFEATLEEITEFDLLLDK